MAYESFNAAMTALANAVRAKFGVSGLLTVAGMTSAVSGTAHTGNGATLSGFNADMTELANAIRTRAGTVGAMTVAEMATAVAGITLGYSSFTDEDECEAFDIEDCNRVAVVLPTGSYTDFKIHGLSSRPSQIKYGANTAGGGGTAVSFTYSNGVASLGSIAGGRLMIFLDTDEIELSPSSNFGSGFAYPTTVYSAQSWQTATNTVLASGYCLMLTFASYGGSQ